MLVFTGLRCPQLYGSYQTYLVEIYLQLGGKLAHTVFGFLCKHNIATKGKVVKLFGG